MTYDIAGLRVEADHPLCVANDRVFPPFADEVQVLVSALGNIANRKVLDVGTGSGVLALTAASLGATAIGTDVNPWRSGVPFRTLKETDFSRARPGATPTSWMPRDRPALT